MRLNYTISFTAVLLSTAMSAGTMAQVGSVSGTGAGSRGGATIGGTTAPGGGTIGGTTVGGTTAPGGATIGGTTGPAPSTSTLPLGTDRQQLDAVSAFRGQTAVPSVIPGAVQPNTALSSAPLPGATATPGIILPRRGTVATVSGRDTLPPRDVNSACLGVSADASVCTGWN